MPHDELPLSARLENHRRRIARLLRAERAPEFLAGVLFKSHDDAALAARETDELVSIQQRMSRKAPHRCGNTEVFFEIARPDFLPGGRVEAQQISLRAERINFPAADERSRARTRRVAHRVRAIVFARPELPPIALRKTQHALRARDATAIKGIARITRLLRELPIHHIHAPIRDRRTGKAPADFHAPAHSGTLRRKFLNDARLPPNSVALRPKPLRPVIRAQCLRGECEGEKSEASFHVGDAVFHGRETQPPRPSTFLPHFSLHPWPPESV